MKTGLKSFNLRFFLILINCFISDTLLSNTKSFSGDTLPISLLKAKWASQYKMNVNLGLTHYNPVLLFYTPGKQEKTLRFSDVFRVYRKATLGCNGLTNEALEVIFSRKLCQPSFVSAQQKLPDPEISETARNSSCYATRF